MPQADTPNTPTAPHNTLVWERMSTTCAGIVSSLQRRGIIHGGRVITCQYVGSRQFGLHQAGSDEDFYIVWAAPTECIVGFSRAKDSLKNDEDERPDWTVHEAAKFVRLVLRGDARSIECLFARETPGLQTSSWKQLVRHRQLFLTKQLLEVYLRHIEGELKQLMALATEAGVAPLPDSAEEKELSVDLNWSQYDFAVALKRENGQVKSESKDGSKYKPFQPRKQTASSSTGSGLATGGSRDRYRQRLRHKQWIEGRAAALEGIGFKGDATAAATAQLQGDSRVGEEYEQRLWAAFLEAPKVRKKAYVVMRLLHLAEGVLKNGTLELWFPSQPEVYQQIMSARRGLLDFRPFVLSSVKRCNAIMKQLDDPSCTLPLRLCPTETPEAYQLLERWLVAVRQTTFSDGSRVDDTPAAWWFFVGAAVGMSLLHMITRRRRNNQ